MVGMHTARSFVYSNMNQFIAIIPSRITFLIIMEIAQIFTNKISA